MKIRFCRIPWILLLWLTGAVELSALNRADLVNGSEFLGDSWYYSEWFGYFEVHGDPSAVSGTIYHNEHGELDVTDSVAIGWWMHTVHTEDPLGTIYTTAEDYPWMYRQAVDAMSWYQKGTSPYRWIFNDATDTWDAYTAYLDFKENSPNGPIPLWWKYAEMLDLSRRVSNQSPLNLGQLKHMVDQTKAYLDTKLGLTPALWNLAYAPYGGNPFPLSAGSSGSDYAMANLGQLKYLASGIYEILNHVNGYDVVNDYLIPMGVPSSYWSGAGSALPWNPATPVAENKYPATLGQLKLVLAFSLDEVSFSYLDFDGNLLSDPWEIAYFEGMGADPDGDPDGDGSLNYEEFLMGTNPHVTDSGPLEFFGVF